MSVAKKVEELKSQAIDEATQKSAIIRATNDELRRMLLEGDDFAPTTSLPKEFKLVIAGDLGIILKNMKETEVAAITKSLITKISEFNDFTDGNDPYAEHDFGSIFIEIEGESRNVFWKIDYYAQDLIHGIDPTDFKNAVYVMSVFFAEDY